MYRISYLQWIPSTLHVAPVTFHPTVLKIRSCQLSTYNITTIGLSTTSPLQDFSLVTQLISFRFLLWHYPPTSLGLTLPGRHKFRKYTFTTKCIGDPWVGKSAVPNPIPRALVYNRALLASKDSSQTFPLLSWSLSMSKQTCVYFPSQIFHFPHANLHPPSTASWNLHLSP